MAKQIESVQEGSHTTHPGGTVADEGHHPTERQYVLVAIFLAIVTGIEVALYYVDTGALNVPLLMILAVVKFIAVVAYFMHLKFDSALFRNMFVGGLILALAVYAVALATMGVLPWDRGENPNDNVEIDEEALVFE